MAFKRRDANYQKHVNMSPEGKTLRKALTDLSRTALVNNRIPIFQASLIGSILLNLLLILSSAVLTGIVEYREQVFNRANAQSLACLLCLSAFSLPVPVSHLALERATSRSREPNASSSHDIHQTAFHASFQDKDMADQAVLQYSRGIAVTLLLVYITHLLFQLKSHAYLNRPAPQPMSEVLFHPETLAHRDYGPPSPKTPSLTFNPKFIGDSTVPRLNDVIERENAIGVDAVERRALLGSYVEPNVGSEVDEQVANAARLNRGKASSCEPSISRGGELETGRTPP